MSSCCWLSDDATRVYANYYYNCNYSNLLIIIIIIIKTIVNNVIITVMHFECINAV